MNHLHKEVATLLLKADADANEQISKGTSGAWIQALHLAITYQHPVIVQFLLKYGGDPTLTDNDGQDAFECYKKQVDAGKLAKKAAEEILYWFIPTRTSRVLLQTTVGLYLIPEI